MDDQPRDAKGRFCKGNTAQKGSGTNNWLPEDLRNAMRSHAPEALAILVEIMRDESVSPRDRIRAAEVVLDRGFGKPQMAVDLAIPAGEQEAGIVFLPQVGS
jgi:hypothetical protein